MKWSEWIKQTGSYLDDNGGKVWCVDLVLNFIKDCLGLTISFHGNAREWWERRNELKDNFEFITPTFKDGELLPGDIGVRVTGGHGYGHIFVIAGSVKNGELRYYDENGRGNYDPMTLQKYSYTKDNITGVLRPRDRSNIDSADAGSPAIAFETIQLALSVTSTTANRIKFKVSASKIKENKVSALTKSELNALAGKYLIKKASNGTTIANKKIVFNKEMSFSALSPNTYYNIRAQAGTETVKAKYTSIVKFFKTPQSYPGKVTSLTADFSNLMKNSRSFKISFNSPSSWGSSSLSKKCRLILFINGEEAGFSDTILGTHKVSNLVINPTTITNRSLNYKDTIQVGVQTGLLENSNFICDESNLVTSPPYYISPLMFEVPHPGIIIGKVYKRLVLYRK